MTSPRVAFVTSGAKGLGFVTVRTLVEAGWDVFFTYRTSHQEAMQLQEIANSLGRSAQAVQADLLDPVQVRDALSQCQKKFSGVDAFVHNFGPFVFERVPLAEYTMEMWMRMMDGNLNNFFWIYRELVQGMRANRFGRIVTVGYDGAAEAAGWRYRAAYGAAKAALAALTRSIAREERENGITANMVCPGDIRGPHKMQMIREVNSRNGDLFRPAVGEDVARVIEFLCQEESQQINGTITEVTGGQDIRLRDSNVNQ